MPVGVSEQIRLVQEPMVEVMRTVMVRLEMTGQPTIVVAEGVAPSRQTAVMEVLA